jgi:hypothetical protein
MSLITTHTTPRLGMERSLAVSLVAEGIPIDKLAMEMREHRQ